MTETSTVTATSEVIDNVFQVSVMNESGTWSKYTFRDLDTTHRMAVRRAVTVHTGQMVTEVAYVGRIGDGCAEYEATVTPVHGK